MSRFLVDETGQVATFDVIIDGVYITQYTYTDGTNGLVTLAARNTSTSVSLQLAKEALGQIDLWIRNIERGLTPPSQIRSKFNEEIQKKATKIESKFKVDGNIVSEAEYSSTTGLITYQPRLQMSIKFLDFKEWIEHSKRLVKECFQF